MTSKYALEFYVEISARHNRGKIVTELFRDYVSVGDTKEFYTINDYRDQDETDFERMREYILGRINSGSNIRLRDSSGVYTIIRTADYSFFQVKIREGE